MYMSTTTRSKTKVAIFHLSHANVTPNHVTHANEIVIVVANAGRSYQNELI